MARSSCPFRKPRETAAERRGVNFRGTAGFRNPLARARLITPALNKEFLMSRAQRAPREGAVLFADSAEYCQSHFGLRGALWAGQGPSAVQRNPLSRNSGASLQSAPGPMTREAGSNLQATWVVGLRRG